MVRNPYDVIRSYRQMDVSHGSVVDIANRWRKANLNILKMDRRLKDQCLVVKYEQLVSSEVQTINSIIDHIGAEFSNGIDNTRCISDIPTVRHFQNVEKAVFSSSVGVGKDELSKEELDVVDPIIADAKTALGYE